MNTNDIARNASTEILANLLIDIDAYGRTAALPDRSGYEAYKSICDRIDSLAERLGTSFRDVLNDKERIEDELNNI